jgi:hypothetical protein
MNIGEFIVCLKTTSSNQAIRGGLYIIHKKAPFNGGGSQLLQIRPFRPDNIHVYITEDEFTNNFVPAKMSKVERIIYGVNSEDTLSKLK